MPIPLIVVGAVILAFVGLCLLRFRLTVTLRDEVEVTLRILCFTLRRYPRRKPIKWKNYSPKKAARIERKKAKKLAKKEAKKAKKRTKGKVKDHLLDNETEQKTTLAEKIRMIRALCAVLFRKTQKHLRLHAARLHISVATGDAAKTAVLYGAVCQALVYLLAMLDRITHLKAATPDVAVSPDFTGERSAADVRLVLSLRVGALALILFSMALAYIKAKLDRKKRRKQKQQKAARAAGETPSQKG